MMADSSDNGQRPQDWEKALSVAYLRCLGQTQKVAAEAAGVGERTIQAWEASSWWHTAVAEANARWLAGVAEKAKRALAISLDANDAQSARWVLERMLPELSPPKQRSEITGKDGEAIKVVQIIREPVDPSNGTDA